MTIDDQNEDEKMQYDINIETVKALVLSSEKIYKYEYLTGEAILPFIRNQIIENLWKNKSSIKHFISKQRLNNEIMNEIMNASKSHNDIPDALSIVDKYIQIAINKLCFAKIS